MNFTLTKEASTAKSKGLWRYTVRDEAGAILDTRHSNRDYAAAVVVHRHDGSGLCVPNYAGPGREANATRDAARYGLKVAGVARLVEAVTGGAK